MTYIVRSLQLVLIALAMVTGFMSTTAMAVEFGGQTRVVASEVPLWSQGTIERSDAQGVLAWCAANVPRTQIGDQSIDPYDCWGAIAAANGVSMGIIERFAVGETYWFPVPTIEFAERKPANFEFLLAAAGATTESLFGDLNLVRAAILADRAKFATLSAVVDTTVADLTNLKAGFTQFEKGIKSLRGEIFATDATLTDQIGVLEGNLVALSMQASNLGQALSAQGDLIEELQTEQQALAGQVVSLETSVAVQGVEISMLTEANATLWRWLVVGGVIATLVVVGLYAIMVNHQKQLARARRERDDLTLRLSALEAKLVSTTIPADVKHLAMLKTRVDEIAYALSKVELEVGVVKSLRLGHTDLGARITTLGETIKRLEDELAKRDAVDPSHGLKAGDEFTRLIDTQKYPCRVLRTEADADGKPVVFVIVTPFTKVGGEVRWRAGGRKPEALFVKVDRHLREQVAKGASATTGEPHLRLVSPSPVGA